MAEILRKFEVYRKTFGIRGYLLALKTKLSRHVYEAEVRDRRGIIYLRLNGSDLYTYEKVFLNEEYDVPVKDPKIIVDAGANIGLSAIYFARKYPLARIFAIEPAESNFSVLERNTKPYANIVPIRGALWDKDTQLDLTDPGSGDWGYQVRNSDGERGIAHSVSAFTVPTFLRRYDVAYIDLLKVDIEGAEKEVFAGALPWIKSVGAIVIELHDWLKPSCTAVFEAVTTGFAVKSTKGENTFRARKTWREVDQAFPTV